MEKEEKVIKGLEICIKNINQVECPNDCPYYSDCTKYEKRYIFQPLLRDALKLIKEQEPRVQQAYEHGMRDAIKHPDCEAAEHDATGCLGYGHSEYDDEPIEVCLMCEKYNGNRGG